MKTRIKPMVSWSIWAGGLSLVMGIVTREFLIEGFQTDNTHMSAVIAAVFAAGLVISFLAALQLHKEWKMLKQIEATGNIPTAGSDLAAMFNRLAGFKASGKTVDIHVAIDTYHTRHNSRVRNVSIIAALVISMGLLGTVVGLIMSIAGLGGIVEKVGVSSAAMMAALKPTVAGMATAFYTTYFGALGGMILRAVAVSQLNSLSELCAEASEYADAHLTASLESREEELNQQMAAIVESFSGMQREIESITVRLSESFETTMGGFGKAMSQAGNEAISATQACMSGMAEQMNAFGGEIGQSINGFNQSIEEAGEELQASFGMVNLKLISAGEGVAESFSGLNASVNESTNTVAGSLAEFKLSLDGTSVELKEAVGELHAGIREATGEMKTLSKARLDAEATEIAGHLSIAAESIQQFLQKKTHRDENQKVA